MEAGRKTFSNAAEAEVNSQVIPANITVSVDENQARSLCQLGAT